MRFEPAVHQAQKPNARHAVCVYVLTVVCGVEFLQHLCHGLGVQAGRCMLSPDILGDRGLQCNADADAVADMPSESCVMVLHLSSARRRRAAAGLC